MKISQLWFHLLCLIHLVFAEKLIKTGSLLTCMQNSQLTASYFDVRFYPSNNTVEFDISAVTTISGDITAHAQLIVYGINIMEQTIDLCDMGFKELCPLSAGRIVVDSNYVLDKKYTKMIPSAAYTVPDLDASVKVVAYSTNDTNTPLACVEARLTNGKTVQTKYASWPIAAISGLGLITSGIISIIGHSNTAAHIASNSISLFVYFQNLSITSMMAVDKVPPIASAWAQNFVWSMGIINAKFMQDAIKWYVQATGGKSTVVVENKDALSISVQKRDENFLDGLIRRAPHMAMNLMKRASVSDTFKDDSLNDSKLYTTDEHDTDSITSKILVLRGIQRVSYLANIEISNYFLTGIVFFLFFVFILMICLMFFKAIVELLIRSNVIKQHKFNEFRQNWATIIKGTLFRLALIALPQISLLTLWEFTERDSAAIVVVAVFLLIIVFGLLLYGATRVIMIGRESSRLYKTPAYLLFGNLKILNRFGFLYVQFRADTYWWLVPLLTYTILRSIFVALIQDYGKAQALCIFIIELVYFVALCWKRPYMDKRTNVFNILIHLVNFFNSIMFLFFSKLFKQPDVVSSICAVVLFVVNAVFALFLLIFTIVTCLLSLLSKNPDTRYQPMKDDRVSFIPRTEAMEKSNKKDTELLALGETVLSGQQPQQLNQSQQLESESDSENSLNQGTNKFPQSRIPYGSSSNSGGFNNRSRTDSLTSSAYVEPSSAVMGTGPQNSSSNNLQRPGISFADTTYKGNSRFNNSNENLNSNPYGSSNSNPYGNPYGNRL
ncbi:putative flavin carrier protein 3 [Wickerhamomyces ciferrii]|uniref:Flavin carrier protein 3 n=1 Tax=Wickerhamomyces ciferrii (strain ATCC 14091 / BCRC 22168 / CBS 111 / JCM 3599 / NBRC 0793 / NRRL Y-1031 F-60-10) TaxID=1206466 RepID=K0KMW0_WICCF|nr:putative flavin carrier protein 3 [Wickerhamomyces ciferrii]CCH46615.1 putative flavin carrier protein 3 [Wickerhamomyces ciferrii]